MSLQLQVFYSRQILHGTLWWLFEQSFELITSPLEEKVNAMFKIIYTRQLKHKYEKVAVTVFTPNK